MRKLIASINMTIDRFCDHTAVIADEELHRNVNELLKETDTILFGRVTYQLMESSWPPIVQNPTGVTSVDEFAVLIDNIRKVVFSHTLKTVSWKNTRLVNDDMKEEVIQLKQQPGKNLLVGSPSLIASMMQWGLIDEFRFCVQPIVLGKGLPLFKNIAKRIDLKLLKATSHLSGAITLFYEPVSSASKSWMALQFNIQRCPATNAAVENIKRLDCKCFCPEGNRNLEEIIGWMLLASPIT